MKKLIALLLLLPVLATADPSPATQRLLNEPANLMDIGIIRVSTVARNNWGLMKRIYQMGAGFSNVSLYTSVGYNLETDKINIRITVEIGLGVYPVNKAKSGCRNIVTKMTQLFRSWVGRSFSHYGFEESSQQKDFAELLFGRTDIYCAVRTIGQVIPGEALVTVRKNLASDEIDVVKGDGDKN